MDGVGHTVEIVTKYKSHTCDKVHIQHNGYLLLQGNYIAIVLVN